MTLPGWHAWDLWHDTASAKWTFQHPFRFDGAVYLAVQSFDFLVSTNLKTRRLIAAVPATLHYLFFQDLLHQLHSKSRLRGNGGTRLGLSPSTPA